MFVKLSQLGRVLIKIIWTLLIGTSRPMNEKKLSNLLTSISIPRSASLITMTAVLHLHWRSMQAHFTSGRVSGVHDIFHIKPSLQFAGFFPKKMFAIRREVGTTDGGRHTVTLSSFCVAKHWGKTQKRRKKKYPR